MRYLHDLYKGTKEGTKARELNMIRVLDRIKVVQGDIVKLKVDAVVNAANPTLLGGGGVDGAIHKAAGPGLLEECKTLKGCPPGEARITGGYNLPAKWIIHTVGPIWKGGKEEEENLLALCYKRSLGIARKYGVKTIAFPAISTGAYGFPSEKAAKIAVREIKGFLQENGLPETIFLVCFNEETCKYLQKAIQEIFGS